MRQGVDSYLEMTVEATLENSNILYIYHNLCMSLQITINDERKEIDMKYIQDYKEGDRVLISTYASINSPQ